MDGLPSLEEIQAAKARLSLAHFVRQAWHVIEPGTPLIWNWHLDVMCDHVQALLEGRLGKNNLVINVPPGSMKSTIVSVCAPAWMWLKTPGWRGIFCSGSEGIALRDSMKCRDLITSEWYQQAFRPSWKLTADQNAKGFYKNTCTGWRKALPAGARITGERGDTIIVDDPNDAAETFSKPAREKVKTWWDNAAANRVSNPITGTRLLIQQRLHEEDLTGHVLASDPDAWDRLVIRQEWEKPQATDPDHEPTTLGWVDPRTQEGELFFPERFPVSVVEGERRRLGSFSYAGQHQQRPTPAEGAIFRKGFVQFFHPEALPKFRRIVLSFDTAFKEAEENDYSVAFAMGETETGFYILDRWKERASYPALKEKARTMGDRWKPTAILIEDKASGQSLIQELKTTTRLPIVPVKVDRDKVSRAHAVVPLWEAGKVYVPHGAPWVDDFLANLYGFPKMAHDDDVDAFDQGLTYLHQGGGSTGFLEFLRRNAEAAKPEPVDQSATLHTER